MVSKENYEIWMLDYLDGDLSDEKKALLFHFLELNPHLKEELNGLDKIFLSPQEEAFAPKHKLLKASPELSDMPYPEYIAIKEMESGLDTEEHHWKSSYLKQDKTRATLFKLFPKVLLKADHSIRYPFKSNLKRVALIPLLTISALRRISSAAAVVMLLLIGSMPLIRTTMDQENTVAVNDTSLPMLTPKTNMKIKTPGVNKEMTVRLATTHVPVPAKEEFVLADNQKPSFEPIRIAPLSGKKIHPIKTHYVNAYEVGLNAMMPIVIANNLADKKEDELALQSQVNQQSEQLARSARVITGSIKLINFLAGNETKVNKVLNQDGQMVAYQVESDNIYIRQRIKNKPVTN